MAAPIHKLDIIGRKMDEKKSVIEMGDRLKQYHNVGAKST